MKKLFLSLALSLLTASVFPVSAQTKINLQTQVQGILPAGNGGTGLNGSAAGAGLILRGNGAGFSLSQSTYPDLIASGNVLYATAANTVGSTTSMVFDGSQFRLSTTGATGGILIGGDTQLYRSAANVLRTPDTLAVDSLLDISAATAGQIKFPATQNASADANTLDDYVEGTFTPTITFGGGSTGLTYSTQYGRYTKIGDIIHFHIVVRLTAKGTSTGDVALNGLPFTASNTADSAAISATFVNNMAATVTGQTIATVAQGSSVINISQTVSGASSSLNETHFTNSSVFRITGFYYP